MIMNYFLSLALRTAVAALLLSCISWWPGEGPALSTTTVVAATATGTSYLRSDPDTTCRQAYNGHDDDESSCLNAKDHFGRPCQLCSIDKNSIYCYNADEARWAKFFGSTCRTSPSLQPKRDLPTNDAVRDA